jgi:hypothetical protein
VEDRQLEDKREGRTTEPEVDDAGAWMSLQSEEAIEEDWWMPAVHTDPTMVAPLLAIGLGLNISILHARGTRDDTTIQALQYGLKGAAYKKWFRERVGDTGGEMLGTLMNREKELLRVVDQDSARPDLVREIVYTGIAEIPAIEENGYSGWRREVYASLFGKYLLSETSIEDSFQREPARGKKATPIYTPEIKWKDRPSTKAAPVINIAFYKWDERNNHFENMRDANVELRKLIDNDSIGARTEFSARLNQMFAEYRTTGAKEYDKAVRDYRALSKKKTSKKQGVGKRKE